MIKKLRFKFVMINMSIVTIMLCVIFVLIFQFTKANLEEESINMMQNIASRPFRLGIPNEISDDIRLPYFIIQLGLQRELITINGGYYDLSDYEFFNALIDVALRSHKTFGVIEEYNLRYYRVNTPLNNRIVFVDITSERATLDSLLKTCLFIGSLSFLIFFGISTQLSKWAVKPVETAWDQQRQFVADASHELKTPLTVIMTNAELVQCQEYDEENKQKFLSGILAMARQMRVLIEEMLELAKADNTNFKEDTSPVDLSLLVSNTLLLFEPVFFEKGLTLNSELEENIKVRGKEGQLCRVLEVLLDNAQKYSKDAGKVWVRLKRNGKGRPLLEVANEGETITPEEAKNIFKRFYRGDQARSRTGSFGLGLSIAQELVQRHGGEIWVESSEGINRFYVELPIF